MVTSKSKSAKEIHWVSPNNHFGIQFRCSECKSLCNEDWTKCSNCGTNITKLVEARTDIDTCWICGEKNNRKNWSETTTCENCRGEKMFCKNDGTLMKRIEDKWLCPKCNSDEIGTRTNFVPKAKRRIMEENKKTTGSKKRVVHVYGADEETKRRLMETTTKPKKKKEISESRKKELEEVIEQMDEKGLLNEVKEKE